MSLLLYAFGATIRLGLVLLQAPMLVLGGLLSLPVLSTVWGVWVWFTQLMGDAGELLLGASRIVLQAGLAYVPIFVIRKFGIRPKTGVAAPSGRH